MYATLTCRVSYLIDSINDNFKYLHDIQIWNLEFPIVSVAHSFTSYI
jgi:hypothetical protein